MPPFARHLVLIPALLAAPPASASEILVQDGNDYSVRLTPNDPLVVSFVATVPPWTQRPLDIFLAVEAGGSFAGERPTLGALASALSTSLVGMNPDTWFGLGSFVDKPLAPLGSITDYEYATDRAVDADVDAWLSTLSGLGTFGGGDSLESQLSALLMIARRGDGEVGFRPDSLRTAIVATDSPYHQAGDVSSRPANDGDGVLDGAPPGSGEDYPSVNQVDQALAEASVLPVFVATPAENVEVYDGLAAALGGASLALAADANPLVTALDGLLSAVASPVELSVPGGQPSLITAIEADSEGDLLAGQSRTFDVTLEWDGLTPAEEEILFDLGFGTATVTIEVPEPSAAAARLAALLALTVAARANAHVRRRR